MSQTPSNANKDKSQDNRKFQIAGGQDLPDTPQDQEKMKVEPTVIDLPDVKDIPGQEHVTPAPLGELADETVSSDDEEGEGLFDEEEDDDSDILMGTEADITAEEENDLQAADEDMPTTDEQNLRQASIDSTDEEGDDLNEKGFSKAVSGSDLDVAGTDEDDANEEIGEEDEENNTYSLGDTDTAEPNQ